MRLDRRSFIERTLILGGAAVAGRFVACTDERVRGDVVGDAQSHTPDTTGTTDVASPDSTATTDAAADVGPDIEPEVCAPTTSDALGPFYEPDAPALVDLGVGLAGALIAVSGRVRDEDCRPIAGATVEVWQADDDGDYHDDILRATITAASDGAWAFNSIMPGRYLQATGLRPAHIHFRVSAPGFRTLVTQLYFEGDPYLQPNDSCGSCGSDDPARIMALDPVGERQAGTFDVTLAAT